MKLRSNPSSSRIRVGDFGIILFVLGGFMSLLGEVHAQVVLDAFPGWDGIAISRRWMPLVVEIANQGSPSNGTIEVSEGGQMAHQLAVAIVDIPSQTRKRMWIYVPPSDYSGWRGAFQVRIINEHGRILQEREVSIEMENLPGRLVAESIPSAWLKMGLRNAQTFKACPTWRSTRILKQHLPDQATGYDGLDALHLGWPEVDDLNEAQRQALLDWIWSGGHLIVSAEEPLVWSRQPWWNSILPVRVTDQKTVGDLVPLQAWLRSEREKIRTLFPEKKANSASPWQSAPGFYGSGGAVVATGQLLQGRVLIERAGVPLVAETRLGRGWVTQVLFQPGREPFRGWMDRTAFWTFLLQRTRNYSDALLFRSEDQANKDQSARQRYSPGNTRHEFSQLLESFNLQLLATRQQLQLPWRLFSTIFVAYILLIGPFDYLSLKRMHKLAWTWVSFPVYVIAATGVIYWLGYWVNHGESEWRQWSVVDWQAGGQRQQVTTQSRFFSARSATYRWRDQVNLFSNMREVEDTYGRVNGPMAAVLTTPAGSRAEISVPIWTSRSFSGRFNQAGASLRATYNREDNTLSIANPTSFHWRKCRWIEKAEAFRELGTLRAGETRTWRLKDIPETKINPAELTNYRYGYGYYAMRGEAEIPNEKRESLIQGLFFCPFLDQQCQTGSVGEGLDLSAGWQEGDALLLAESDAPANWPWVLAFQTARWTHRVTHRIYFPAPLSNSSQP
jgi:hypothetical protein